MGQLLQEAGFKVAYADYGTDEEGNLRNLADRLRNSIKDALADQTFNTEDATQVDIVAPSMGGLVSRAFMANMHPSASVNSGNQYQDEIRRLIMVGTPNYGTRLGAFEDLGASICDILDFDIEGNFAPEAQAQQMNYGSDFIWELHNKWTQFMLDHPVFEDQILAVAGTGGLGDNDDLVNVSSAALTDSPDKQVRYVPYVHQSIFGLQSVVAVQDACYPLQIGCDPGTNHKTFRFVREFLATGNVLDQAAVWDDAPTFDEGSLLLRLVDSNGPISAKATISADVDFIPSPGFLLVLRELHEHENEQASTVTVAGVEAQIYDEITVQAIDYHPETVHQNTIIRAARTTVLPEIELTPGADLVVSDLSRPADTSPGKRIGVNFTLKNEGQVKAGSSTLRFALSDDALITPSDTDLLSLPVPSLSAGQDTVIVGLRNTAKFFIPSDTPYGCYSLRAIADSGDDVAESDEANNTRSVPLRVATKLKFGKLISLTKPIVGSVYSAELTAFGGILPWTWRIDVGQLPPGLNLTADGDIHGTPTTPGTFPFTVRLIDSGGSGPCARPLTKAFKIVVSPNADQSAPNTTITEGPTGTITTRSATFTWTGLDNMTPTAGLLYAWYLEPLQSTYSPFSATTSRLYTNLPNGTYTFFVKAKDQAGNVDPTPATRTFTVQASGGSPPGWGEEPPE